MTAIIFTGIQASGKSSYYSEKLSHIPCVSLDIVKTRRKEQRLIAQLAADGSDMVIDNTNPTASDRQRYIPMLKDMGYEIVGYYFRSEIAKCIERNMTRPEGKRVPDKALAATFNKLELPSLSEGYDKLYYVRMENGGFVTEEWRNEI